MKLSMPIYRLKREARLLSRAEQLPLHEALNRLARAEGFQSWSQLAARYREASPVHAIAQRLVPGDVVIVAARPGYGKTMICFELAAQAMAAGQICGVFSFDMLRPEAERRLAEAGYRPEAGSTLFRFDDSEDICAERILETMADAPAGSLIVVDYLQLMDQRRTHAALQTQMDMLRAFVARAGHIALVISQVDKRYEQSGRDMPGLADVRLPNPLDLRVFSKACFLNEAGAELREVA